MKILRKIIVLIQVMLIILTLMSTTQINTFASSSINGTNRKITNVAVLLNSFDDFAMMQIRQNLQNIQKENQNKVRFSFYDGKNNIAIQNEILDSLLRSNIDLFIVNLVDSKENIVKDFILKVKQRNVPLIILGINPQVISNVSKYSDKVAFILPNSEQQGTIEGKILTDLWNTSKGVIDKNGNNILQYVLLSGTSDNIVAIDRSKYVISAINNSGIKTEQLALVNADWSKELAKVSIENLFLKYADKIEAIIANNDAIAIGAIEALQKYGYNTGDKSKYIPVVGIDGIPEARDLVDKGFMTGTVIQDPKSVAENLYTIGMNLVNNVDSLENTNLTFKDGAILVDGGYKEYTNKANTP